MIYFSEFVKSNIAILKAEMEKKKCQESKYFGGSKAPSQPPEYFGFDYPFKMFE